MTSPVIEVIPKEIQKDILPTIIHFGSVIDEVVNFGSHVLIWDLKKARGGDENVPPIMLFRHYLDLIDSISILAKHACGDTSKIILRSALEVTFGLEYLFEKNTYERSMDFLLMEITNEIRTLKKFNPRTPEGSNLYKVLEKEFSLKDLKLDQKVDFKKRIGEKEELLKLPQYSKSLSEYQRLKQNGKKNLKWYGFYDGPQNFLELSTYLKQQSLYELLYRKWSGPTHGTDIYLGRMLPKKGGGVDIVQLRYMKDLQEVVNYSLSLSVKVFNAFIRNRLPDRIVDFQSWYLSIRDTMLKLSQHKLIDVK